MRIWLSHIKLVAEEVKIVTEAVMTLHKIRQQEIAKSLGVNQATVHRWISTDDYQMHLPVFAVATLTDLRFRPLVEALLTVQARPHGLKVVNQ